MRVSKLAVVYMVILSAVTAETTNQDKSSPEVGE